MTSSRGPAPSILGVVAVVQELLGQAEVSATLDRYSHMTPRLMSNAAVVMDRLSDAEA